MKRFLTAAKTKVVIGLLYLFGLTILATSAGAETFHFTVTSDQLHDGRETFGRVLNSINNKVGGPGVFHVSVGDIDYATGSSRAHIDANFGSNFPWFGVVGNHDAETVADMNWLRTEYNTANGSPNRQPLKDLISRPGPPGSVETTYSWDYANAHFIVLNCYWNGGTAPNSDSDSNLSRGDDSGDITLQLYNWLKDDLEATNKPFIFIFVHEPAFPYNHHYGDSLDNYPGNRDAFWSLLESEKVTAVFVGHNHYYYKHRGDVRGHTYNYPIINSWRTQDPNIDALYGRVWQISTGNAGKVPGGVTAGPTPADYLPTAPYPNGLQWNGVTFIDVNVTEDFATINVYRDIRDERVTQTPLLGTYTNFSLYDTITVSGDFLAYNDCVFDAGLVDANTDPCGNSVHYGDPCHVTAFGIGTISTDHQDPDANYVSSGELKDYTTGAGTGVICTMSQSGGVIWQPWVGISGTTRWTGGYDTAAGTDAYNTFHSIADMTGVIYYGSTGWWVDVNLTGLNFNKTYTFATSASRAKSTTDGEPGYTDRYTLYTISGIDGATNASTPGVTEVNTYSVKFNTGNNHNEGYVARWTGINPGADGSFKVRAQAAPDANGGRYAYAFDVFMLREEPMVPDNEPPTPNPMTWATVPTATGPTSITMTATTATDPNYPPVKYYFECTNHGEANSIWQISPTYVATGLTPSTQYTFRVKARDNAPIHNETAWSTEQSATTQAAPPPPVSIIGSWVTGTTHTKESGTNRALVLIAHAEDNDEPSIALNSVTYGGRSMTKVIEKATGTTSTSRAYAVAFILNDANITDSNSSGTFVTTWNQITVDDACYISVFLKDVNQTVLVGSKDSNGVTNAASLKTAALSTKNGDMVIDAATCSQLGTYSVNNGFTKAAELTFPLNSTDGVDGYKSATGVAETPMVTHSTTSNRQVIIGFVVQAGVPGKATNPTPANGVTGVGVTTDLSWTAGPNATSHDVYFGTTSPGTFRGNQTGTTYEPNTLSYDTIYYWRINEKNAGGTTTGDVWSFTTASPPVTRTLTVTTSTGGTVTQPGLGDFNYPDGTVVDINAVPSVGYHFVNWTGDTGTIADVNAAITTITMNGNYTIQANFGINQYTISGNTGVGEVTLEGLGIVSDGSGNYTKTVDYGWSGTVTPSKAGYTFAPASRTYTAVAENHIGDDYAATLNTYTISGNTGVGDVTLEGLGIVSDGSGNYTKTVDYGWSGTVTPSKAGYTFSPADRTYTNVAEDHIGDNYAATLNTYTISGNTGVGDVTLEGLGVISDGNGNYTKTVNYGWSGTVTPSKAGYTFAPASRTYTAVAEDHIGDDYAATLNTYTISGNTGVGDVTLEGLGIVSDGSGNYTKTVDYGWSGTVTPSKAGYTFSPADRTYTAVPNLRSYVNVSANQPDQNYVAYNIYDLDCDGYIGFGDVEVISENWLQTGENIPGDLYEDEANIVNFLDFAEFANVW